MVAILNHIKPLLEVLQVVFKDDEVDIALARLEAVAGQVMLRHDLLESPDSQLSTRIWARDGGDDDELPGENSRAGLNHLLRAAYLFEKEGELEEPRPLGFIEQPVQDAASKEVAKLKVERDILKKAAAYFAKDVI